MNSSVDELNGSLKECGICVPGSIGPGSRQVFYGLWPLKIA